jgi:membrane protein
MRRRPAERFRGAVTGAFFTGVAVGSGLVFGLLSPSAQGTSAEPDRLAAALVGRRGFTAVAFRAGKAFIEDRIPAAAAAVTFYFLLALFPALSAFVSLYGLVGDVEGARRQVLGLGGMLPAGAIVVLGDQLERLAATNHGTLGMAFALSLAVSIWSANAGVKALIAGLNISYETKENRGFIRLNLTSLGFTVGAILLAILLVGAVVDTPALLARAGLPGLEGYSLARWPALLIVSTLMIAVLYRFAPAQRVGRWRWISPGSAMAAAGWMAMSAAFSWSVANFGHYDRTYGSLGAIVGFLTWIWLSLMIVLAGAELNCELERRG